MIPVRTVGRTLGALLVAALLSGLTPVSSPAPVLPLAELVSKWDLGDAGVAVFELNSGRLTTFNGDRRISARRLAALPLTAATYRLIADKRLQWAGDVGTNEETYGPELSAWTPLPRMRVTDMLERVEADPVSVAATLASAVGAEGTTKALQDVAGPGVALEPEQALEVSAAYLARLVAKATRAEIVDPGASDQLLGFLKAGPDAFEMGNRAFRDVHTAYRLEESPVAATEVAWVQEQGFHYVVAVVSDVPDPDKRRVRGLEADIHAALKAQARRDWARLAIRRIPSHNHGERDGQAIDAIVLHHTVIGSSAEDVAEYFRRPDIEASSHYTVAKDGSIVQHVDDCQAAWHAGPSEFKGRPRVNKYSIGIEIVNRGDNKDPYTTPQYRALARLMVELMDEYGISWDRVTGHRDVALPRGRKSDPSDNFSYERLRREVAAVRASR